MWVTCVSSPTGIWKFADSSDQSEKELSSLSPAVVNTCCLYGSFFLASFKNPSGLSGGGGGGGAEPSFLKPPVSQL